MNKAMLVGKISQIKEMKTFGNGANQLMLNVCTNENFKKNGEWINEPTFHALKAWNKTANYIAEHLRVGDMVSVEGKIKIDNYEKDGVKKSFNYINLEKINRLQKGKPKEKQADFDLERDQGSVLHAQYKPESSNDYAADDIPF